MFCSPKSGAALASSYFMLAHDRRVRRALPPAAHRLLCRDAPFAAALLATLLTLGYLLLVDKNINAELASFAALARALARRDSNSSR